jgi:Variant UBP zinc finger
MSVVSTVISVIRGDISKLKIPGTHEKVYNDECMLSFDSPFSENGLFVNMSTFFGYGVDYYLADSARTNCRLFVHEKWTQIPRAETTMQTEGEVLHCAFKSRRMAYYI